MRDIRAFRIGYDAVRHLLGCSAMKWEFSNEREGFYWYSLKGGSCEYCISGEIDEHGIVTFSGTFLTRDSNGRLDIILFEGVKDLIESKKLCEENDQKNTSFTVHTGTRQVINNI